MKAQLSGFRQAFDRSEVDFTILDAPCPASGPAYSSVTQHFKGPFYEWWNYVEEAPGKHVYVGWQNSLAFVQDQVATRGPFDVVLGFSQGAAMATLLTAHYYATSRHVPYAAVVLCCGKLPQDGMPVSLQLQPNRLKFNLPIPSLHILGKRDSRYGWGLKLADSYDAGARHMFLHDDGHRFPTVAQHKPMYDDMVRHLRLLCGSQTATDTYCHGGIEF
ncbi:Aste57867_21897 [Aphanomyces stellatus]|uniref:Aste57867_21897 protein n=1 Tax=Aphanomyces stellatus TaxID=120398 RepID=A0A485LK28_9STRA|nr:hypothetical protein As57867_021828 [Aphanomyces stellatus]VFT98565.1 Aste57867_21897 [Aphanomyces stellatus]